MGEIEGDRCDEMSKQMSSIPGKEDTLLDIWRRFCQIADTKWISFFTEFVRLFLNFFHLSYYENRLFNVLCVPSVFCVLRALFICSYLQNIYLFLTANVRLFLFRKYERKINRGEI